MTIRAKDLEDNREKTRMSKDVFEKCPFTDERLMEYFMSQTDKRFDKLEQKIDSLSRFNWKMAGGLIALSVMAGIITQFIGVIK